jgi:hypothetical protein
MEKTQDPIESFAVDDALRLRAGANELARNLLDGLPFPCRQLPAHCSKGLVIGTRSLLVSVIPLPVLPHPYGKSAARFF